VCLGAFSYKITPILFECWLIHSSFRYCICLTVILSEKPVLLLFFVVLAIAISEEGEGGEGGNWGQGREMTQPMYAHMNI
jgi:hypothetical protein